MSIGAGWGDFNSTRTPSPAGHTFFAPDFAVPDGFAKWRLSRHNETHFGDCIAILQIAVAFIPRLLSAGRDHYFLLGPRGTGKTSWCTSVSGCPARRSAQPGGSPPLYRRPRISHRSGRSKPGGEAHPH